MPSLGRSLMYSRKSARPRMEPPGTPALTGYSFKTFRLEPLEGVYYPEKKKYNQIPDLKFHNI